VAESFDISNNRRIISELGSNAYTGTFEPEGPPSAVVPNSSGLLARVLAEDAQAQPLPPSSASSSSRRVAPSSVAPSTDTMDAMGINPTVAPSVTLEGVGIDPANYPTEEGLRRDREKHKTPGVGDVATAEIAKRFNDIYESNQQPNVGGDSATYQDADGNYRNPVPNEVSFPAEGGVLNRDDVIAYKRGIISSEPSVVPPAPDQTVPVPVPATATAATDTAGGSAPKANFDFKYPNTGKTDDVFIDPTDSKVYFDDRFDKTSPMTKAFSQLVSSLSYGLIDLDKISKKQRDKGLEAYQKTQTLAYDNKGRVIGVKDVDGSTIRLGSQPQDDDDTGGDDGCPPGFRRVNGVCQPIDGVSANPADDIADDIEKATMPIIRPLDPPTGDVPTGPVADDPSGIDFRRPNYFAGGGAVSDGMGSAIDNFISAMSR